MTRFHARVAGFLMGTAIVASAAVALAQAPAAVTQAPQPRVVEPARTVQPTRSYRSYSVAPRGGESRRASGEATWRHANSKAEGRFHTGR